MRKAIMMLLAIGLIVGIGTSAMAAVENVKVGGDITIKGIYRSNFDLAKDGVGLLDMKGMHYIYAGTRVYVCADLSNNVSTMIRFINERDFGNDYLREIEGSVILDLAYVKLADLFVPGLNLTVGRQEYQIGDGLVVGSRYRALDYVGADIGTAAIDLGMQKAFDAIKIDYALASCPVTMELFRSKIVESYINPTYAGISLKDVDLTSLSVNVKGDSFSVNPYLVNLSSDGILGVAGTDVSLSLWTIGAIGAWNPVEALNLKLELAKQFGEIDGPNMDFKGWAGQIAGSWGFGGSLNPVVKAGYSHFTGQDFTKNDISAWIPVFPANVSSRVGKIAYASLFPVGESLALSVPMPAVLGTGLGALNLGFAIQPTDKLGVSVDFYNLRALKTLLGNRKALGNEIDVEFSYAYSEDVSFGLDLGYLLTGGRVKEVIGAGNQENAWQAIASMKVAF